MARDVRARDARVGRETRGASGRAVRRRRTPLRELDLAALLGDVAFKSDVNDAIACVKSSLPKRRRVGTWDEDDAMADDPAKSSPKSILGVDADASMEAFFRDFMAKRDERDEWRREVFRSSSRDW